MRTHLTSNTDGGIIASLSIPWGDTRGTATWADTISSGHATWS